MNIQQKKNVGITGLFKQGLFWLVMLLLMITALGCFYVLGMSREAAYSQLYQQADNHLNRYLLSLQHRLQRYQDIPTLLSNHSLTRAALLDPQDRYQQSSASSYYEQVNHTIGAADVYLMDRQGTTVAASNWAEARSFVGKNYAFRPYFQAAIEGRPGRYFALGADSGKRGYYFSHPVYQHEEIIGVMVVKIDLNEIEEGWNDPQVEILVTDMDGVIFISTRKEWKFKTLEPLSKSDRLRIADSLRYGKQPLTALQTLKRKETSVGKVILLAEHINRSFAEARPKEYLILSRQLEESGLKIVVLAETRSVGQQLVTTTFTLALLLLAVVLLLMFIRTRHRSMQERALFKQRETDALEANEKRVRDIIDNTRAGLITLDNKGRIISFNTMAEQLFRYQQSEIEDHFFSQLLVERDRRLFWKYLTAEDEQRQELIVEVEGRRKDGSCFPVELIIGRMSSESSHLIATIHDITERKRYEDQLKRFSQSLELRVKERTSDLKETNDRLQDEMLQHQNTQNELIQTAKLAVLGQLSAGINHELNQPLTAIRTYAENALAFLKKDRLQPVEDNLQEISELTLRMAQIIYPLKEFARKTSGEAEAVCLQNVADGARSILYAQLQRAGAEVIWPEGMQQTFLRGDTLRLEQVLVNLISNGLQAMSGQTDARIEISCYQQEGEIILEVRDYGPGIPVADLERVFEPFYTTKQAGEGLGLGLSISHRIIENMGGKLSARNLESGGAVFTVALPAADLQMNDQ